MDSVLRLWSWASLWALILYEGWSLARFGFTPVTIILIVIPLLWFASPLYRWMRTRKSVSAAIFPVLRGSVVVALLLMGMFLARSNPHRLNEWMDNSAIFLGSVLSPVQSYGEEDGRVILTPEERERAQEWSSKLSIFPGALGKRILVSFDKRLAILDSGTVRPLLGSGVQLSLSSLLPDGSFLYYTQKTTPQAPTGRIETLTRARIENNVLQKIWERKTPGMYMHHWGDAFEGIAYYPGKYFADLPDAKSTMVGHAFGNCKKEDAIHDVIRLFDVETGRHIRDVEILPIIASSQDGVLKERMTNCKDPLHLNDVQIIKDDTQANFFPGGKVGDMLLSFRNISAIALVDGETLQVKWSLAKDFVRQHAPRITDWGTVIIFDNLGSDKENGSSRIIEMDIATKNRVGIWEATKGDFFESDVRGKVTMVGKEMLIQEQDWAVNRSSMFMLHCPSFPISSACTKTRIFAGPVECAYDNAVLLPGDSLAASSSSVANEVRAEK